MLGKGNKIDFADELEVCMVEIRLGMWSKTVLEETNNWD